MVCACKSKFLPRHGAEILVVVEMSVYKYAGGETLNTLKSQTTVSSVDEFNTLYQSRKRLLDIKDYFYFEDK